MRSDLNKVLCEHERSNSKDHYKNYRNLKKFNRLGEEGENVPSREGMKQRYGWEKKHFGENLNALYGAVRKAVGRKWNDFYSELCKNFDKRSVINQHILLHLFQYIEVNTVYVDEDGDLAVQKCYAGKPEKLKNGWTEYYVDPRDGIIKRNKYYKTISQISREHAKKKKLDEEKVLRQLDDRNVLRLIDGVWYHFTLEEVPEGKIIYEKPAFKNEFNRNPAWSRDEPVMVQWHELDQKSKERHGTPRAVGNTVRDLFTNQTLIRTKQGVKVLFGDSSAARWSNHKMNHLYHATKKTASHKQLKKAGII